MATTKKPTGAAETAEQAQADIFPAEAARAVNEAVTKPEEAQETGAPTYTAAEFAKAAGKVFAGKYSTDLVLAAFAVAKKEEATIAEAEEIVKNFANKEVKN